MQALVNLFSSSSTLRVAHSFTRSSRSIYLSAKPLQVCASTTSNRWQSRIFTRFISTPQFDSFVSPADVTKAKISHAHMATEKIGDAADKQIQNRNEPLTVEERWAERSKRALENASRTPPAHKYSGRTVHVRVEGDLTTAFRQLDNILHRNRVRATLRMTERHEKPGVKRRRLSSQRWRKRFADEVRKKVQLVMKIRDRGA